MNQGYEAFCMADPLFYDALHTERTAGANFATAERELPDGWQRREQDTWLTFNRADSAMPKQGWKIHAAACLDNAERVLEAVWDYCIPRKIDFKFLRSPSALVARVSKYAPRGGSAKLVTIYPADDAACETILRELGELLDGEPSPYILSDLRWGEGPLYVRYGAFVKRYCVSEAGQVVPAIADETGTLVPDRRDPTFYVPPWVTLPDFLAPHLAARNSVTLAELPYTIDQVLHFSNGGGVYVGRDTRTDEKVVLKEGRPHCGLDAWHVDAVHRVRREYDMLRRLADVPGIPKVHELLTVGGHVFLVMEFVEGRPLNKALVSQYPLTDPTATPEDYVRYVEWALKVHRQLEESLAEVHERGVVYGDLHLFNVIIRDDDTIALLDFEVASLIEQPSRPGLGNPGFAAPRGTIGADVDRYALACMRLALFMPTTDLLWLSRPKARHYAELIAENFPVPKDFLDKAVEVIVPADAEPVPGPRFEPDPAGWPEVRDSLVRAIVASATPDREDRLFPGDIQQFTYGGLGLAFGAAGVLYALSVTGAGRYPEFEEWLLRRAKKPAPGTLPGLYEGLHGVAFALDHLGYQQDALDVIDMCLREDWESLGLDLRAGLSGVGLNLLRLADRTGEPALRVAAHRAAELVAERLGEEDSVPETSGQRGSPFAGLMHGSSGAALLLLRAFDDTGDSAFLDRAAVAIRQDLRRCIVRDTGTMEVNEEWRTMPYLEVGSVGIGLAIDQYLAHRDDQQFAEASPKIELAARSKVYAQSGLFTGRAGILLYLAGRSPAPATDPKVARQVRGMAWHALPYADGLAFPGNGLRRLSMDLATGTAGVLLAFGAALHDEPVHAPLLAPTEVPAPQTPASTDAGPLIINN